MFAHLTMVKTLLPSKGLARKLSKARARARVMVIDYPEGAKIPGQADQHPFRSQAANSNASQLGVLGA